MQRPKQRTSKSGPAIIADIAPGSHICAFYETPDDLFDLVLSFFTTGLDQGELCVWLVPDGIDEKQARDIAANIAGGQEVEIHTARGVYLRNQVFERDPVINFWDEKAQEAARMNRPGTRASGDALWLHRNDWSTFLEYETDLNRMIVDKPFSLLCTYPFLTSKAGDVYDVVRAHQFALAKRNRRWEVITAPALERSAQAEIAAAGARISSLPPRERQVLDAIIDGHPNKIIARDLAIDVRTVETHRAHLMRRLGVRSMVEAVRLGTLARLASKLPFHPLP